MILDLDFRIFLHEININITKINNEDVTIIVDHQEGMNLEDRKINFAIYEQSIWKVCEEGTLYEILGCWTIIIIQLMITSNIL